MIFFQQLKKYARSPELFSTLIILGLSGAAILVSIFYMPIYLSAAAVIIFFVVVVTVFKNTIKLIETNFDSALKTREVETLIKNLTYGVIVYDPNLKIIQFNRAAEEIFRLQAAEVVGQQISPSLAKNPRLRNLAQILFPSLAPSINQISQTGVWPQITDISLENPHFEVHTILDRLIDDKNNVLGFVKLIQDTTREKEMMKAKNEFIDVAAHQLRTPLTAINWAVDLLDNTQGLATDVRDIVNNIKQVATRALKITNDLLDAAQIEEGKFGYNFENIDLIKIINNAIEEIMPFTKQRSLKVTQNIIDQKPLMIKIDQNKIGMVITNILDNAIKYNTQNGEIFISINILSEENTVKVSIKDTGTGIPKDDQKKIFQKLFRGNNAAQFEPNGSGLGLYIAKNIIQAHGGKIGFESIPNRGSEFWFTLPYGRT